MNKNLNLGLKVRQHCGYWTYTFCKSFENLLVPCDENYGKKKFMQLLIMEPAVIHTLLKR
jgi:hypothetical protein